MKNQFEIIGKTLTAALLLSALFVAGCASLAHERKDDKRHSTTVGKWGSPNYSHR